MNRPTQLIMAFACLIFSTGSALAGDGVFAIDLAKGSVGLNTVTDASGSWTFQEGDAVIDIMNVWHTGTFPEPTELIVFYAGAPGIPLSVKQGNHSELAKRCSHGLAENLR